MRSGGLVILAKLAKIGQARAEGRMQILTAKDAKYGFGRLIDLARAEPIAVAKHGRTVVVVLSIEEYERLKALDAPGSGTDKLIAGKTLNE
jgi:prevent-host-death family protein